MNEKSNMNYKLIKNKRASKNLWNEFTNISKIMINEIINDDEIQPWLIKQKKHLNINERRMQILSGIAPDVIYVPRWEINFYARNKLLEPLSSYINLFDNYIEPIYVDNIVYSYMELIHSYYTFMYDKNIINQFGLIDPIELYKLNMWNWETFLSLLLSVKNDTGMLNYDPLWGAIEFEQAILNGNGVESLIINYEGKIEYAIDEKFINALNFINDLYTKYEVLYGFYVNENIDLFPPDINVLYNYTGMERKDYNDLLNGFINKDIFMIEIPSIDGMIQLYNDRIYNAGIDRAFICVPEGPDAKDSRTGNGWKDTYDKNQLCYAISSSCVYPEAAATYIGWVLSDKDDWEHRNKLLIDKYYNGSFELYQIGIEWSQNNDNINISNGFGPQLVPFLNDNLPYLDNDIVKKQAQDILDMYFNIF